MTTPQDEFANAFKATVDALADGKSGADIAPPQDAEAAKALEEKQAGSKQEEPETKETPDGQDTEKDDEKQQDVKADAADDDKKEAAKEAAKEPVKEKPSDAKADQGGAKLADGGAEGEKEDTDKSSREAAEKAAREAAQKQLADQAKAATDAKASEAAAKKAEEDAKKAEEERRAAEEAAKPKPFEYTEEEKEKLAEFEKEWTDFPGVFDLREKRLKHELVTGVEALLREFGKQISETLAPVVSTHLQSTEERHFSEIKKAHPDFEEVQEKVIAWIDKQPSYLQPVLQAVVESGTAADVIDVITRFKNDTGYQPESQNPDGKKEEPKPAQAHAPDANKVHALAAVPHQRTRVVSDKPAPVDDYETSWKKTVDELSTSARR